MAQATHRGLLHSPRFTLQSEFLRRRTICSPAIGKHVDPRPRAPVKLIIGSSFCLKLRSLYAFTFRAEDTHAALGCNGFGRFGSLVPAAYNTEAPSAFAISDDPAERKKLEQVAKRLDQTGRHFKRLGILGFWGQLTCTVVAAIILAFTVAVTGATTSPAAFYLTAAGIVAGFISVFWSFGYLRLADQLRGSVENPTKAPPRLQVVKTLKNGVVINLVGMAATILGMQANVGTLVAKALTSSAAPFVQGSSAYNPVLALDVFLVQACANTSLSHYLGIFVTLELLRSVTLSQLPSDNVVIKLA